MLGGLCLVRQYSSTFEYLFCSGLVRSSLSALFLFFPGLFLVVVSPPPVFVLSCFRCVCFRLLFVFRFRFSRFFRLWSFGFLSVCLWSLLASGRFTVFCVLFEECTPRLISLGGVFVHHRSPRYTCVAWCEIILMQISGGSVLPQALSAPAFCEVGNVK